ncbi:hypothetical protein ABZ468_42905 [Streptomyces sp. NPDC005708]|uniref:hypothetical protein n=1 Tax=Streptomyces sp. NPDC005708 TaxID=3154564 RepID=UPI003404CF78
MRSYPAPLRRDDLVTLFDNVTLIGDAIMMFCPDGTLMPFTPVAELPAFVAFYDDDETRYLEPNVDFTSFGDAVKGIHSDHPEALLICAARTPDCIGLRPLSIHLTAENATRAAQARGTAPAVDMFSGCEIEA